MADDNILKMLKKIIEERLVEEFLQACAKEDVEQAKKLVQENGSNASPEDLKEVAIILNGLGKAIQLSQKLQNDYAKRVAEEREAFFNGTTNDLLEVVAGKNTLEIIKKITSNDDLKNQMLDVVLRKNGIEQASKSLHEKGIVATRDEIIEAVRIMEAVRRVRERYLTSQMEQHREEDKKVTQAFKDGIVADLNSIKKGYDKVMTMYVVAFYTGIFLIGAAVYSAIFLKEDLLTTILGGLGTADLITSFIYRPAQELQNSRGNLVQLKSAYLNWINDLNNWNAFLRILEQSYLRSSLEDGQDGRTKIKFEDIKSVSKIMIENLEQTMRLIDQYAELRNDTRNNNASRGTSEKQDSKQTT